MGKNNNNRRKGNGQQQRPPRYTGKNIDYMGDAGRMKRHAVDVFREMSHGRYNFNNIAEFNNRDFLYAAIQAAEENMKQSSIISSALNYAYGMSNDPDVVALKNRYISMYNGWMFIRNSMIQFTNTMDFGALMGMARQLSSNRDLRL